jgi:predicted glutamine amidotransferase
MCVILIKPSGVKIPENFEEYFKRGARANFDGSGFAIHKKSNNYITFRKNLDIEKVVKSYKSVVDVMSEKEKTESTIMFHARIRTAGIVSNFNCHPFVLQNNSFLNKKNRGTEVADASYNPVMMHNGGFHEYSGNPTYSDTYIFNELVLSKLKIDDLLKLHKTDKIGGGKVAILLPRSIDNLVLSGNFITDKETGLIMSNTSCMPRIHSEWVSWDHI